MKQGRCEYQEMQEKIYGGIDRIPRGKASEELTPGCLVLEGGAFKGLYTQGVLDALMTAGINLQCVIGISAGGLAGVNYVSGQIGRSARVALTYRHDSRYVGLKAFRHSHSIVDVGFLTEERGIYEPLDKERFFSKESWAEKQQKKKWKRSYQVRNSTYLNHHYGHNWSVRYLRGLINLLGYLVIILFTAPVSRAYKWRDALPLIRAYRSGIREELGPIHL